MEATVTKDVFGTYQDQTVTRFVATNPQGTRMAVSTLGATWQEFSVLEGDQRQQLIFHYDTLADYVSTPYQLGKTIGRVAGRIKNGALTVAGQTYHVPATELGNAIHGGPNGFSNLLFEGTPFTTADSCGVRLTRTIPSNLDQYPGNLELMVTFTLTNDNTVEISFTGSSDADTLFNPTNHVYWNVTPGQTSLDQQWLRINGSHRAELNADKTPTGILLPVAGTAYDFTTKKAVKTALADLQQENGGVEFDDIYQVQPSMKTPIASLGDLDGKRQIDIYSRRNGLVIYTANPADQAKHDQHQYSALATEAQVLPDSVHHPEFGSISLPAGVTQTTSIRYHYQALK
jgi:aldose 1-epimerase